MTRPRGGYIGFNRVPAATAINSAASGVWTLREAEALKRAGTWPFVAPGGVATGLQAWYDASDSATLFDATTGGSLVAADGGVARWEDKSGNSRHMTQGTAGSRPTRKTAIQGGLDVLRFDGSADFMSVASSTATFNFIHTGDHTIFMAFKANVANSARRRLLDNCINNGSPSGGRGFSVAYFNDFGTATPYSKIGQLVVNTNGAVRVNSYTGDNSYPNTTYCVLTIVGDPGNATDGNRATFYNNGSAKSETPNGEGAALPTADATYDLTLFTSGGDTNRTFAEGDVGEIILYDSALSNADRALVEDYLLAKWGIT